MRLPVSKAVLQNDLNDCIVLLQRWQAEIDRGIPGYDMEASHEVYSAFMLTFISELTLIHRRIEILTDVLMSAPELS